MCTYFFGMVVSAGLAVVFAGMVVSATFLAAAGTVVSAVFFEALGTVVSADAFFFGASAHFSLVPVFLQTKAVPLAVLPAALDLAHVAPTLPTGTFAAAVAAVANPNEATDSVKAPNETRTAERRRVEV
jgi:hypothetical protein